MCLISGRAIPAVLAVDGCSKKISADLLPEASLAADLYEREVGSLTRVSQFGTNPFQTEQDQAAVEAEFVRRSPDVTVMLDNAVNNQPQTLLRMD